MHLVHTLHTRNSVPPKCVAGLLYGILSRRIQYPFAVRYSETSRPPPLQRAWEDRARELVSRALLGVGWVAPNIL